LKIDAGARKCILKITEKWRCQATQDGLQGEVAVAVVPGH
jgi:hypothetical protein